MYIMEIIPIIGIIKYQYYGDNNIMIDIITDNSNISMLQHTGVLTSYRNKGIHWTDVLTSKYQKPLPT